MSEQAMGEILTDYVIENANLKIDNRRLQLELNEAMEELNRLKENGQPSKESDK